MDHYTSTQALDGRTRRRDANAARLYDAAYELLATRSYDEISVEDICERARVGRATFFRIYDSKAGLVLEFNRRLARDVADRLAETDSTSICDSLEAVRRTVVEAWSQAGRGQVGMAREFLRSAPSSDPHAAHPELLQIVTERVAASMDAGELPDIVPADLLGSLALIAITAPLVYADADPNVDPDQLSRILLAQWHAGVVAGAPAPSRAGA